MNLSPHRQRLILAAILLLFFALLYFPVLGYGYLSWDDPVYLHERPALEQLSLGDWSALFRLLSPREALAGRFWEYFPVRDLSYGLEVGLAGFSASLQHATNIALHLLITFLIFLIAKRFEINGYLALMGAAFFTLHPVAIEPVVWISGRKDLLYSLFSLAALYFVIEKNSSDNFNRKRMILIISFILASYLSKGPGVIALALVTLFLFRLPQRLRKRLSYPLAGLALAAIGWIALSLYIGQINAIIKNSNASSISHYFEAIGAPIVAIKTILLPFALSPAKMPIMRPWFSAYESWVMLALIIGALLYWRRKSFGLSSYLFVGFLLSVLPTSGIISVAQSRAERFYYLPLVFLSLWLISLLDKIVKERRYQILIGIAFVFKMSVLLSISFNYRNAWRDDISLWKYVLASNPEHPVANGALGMKALEQGHLDLAERLFKRSLKKAPRHETTWTNLGLVKLYQYQSQKDHRLAQLKAADDAFNRALKENSKHGLALYGKAKVALVQNNEKEAEIFLKKALKTHSAVKQSIKELFVLLKRQGRNDELKKIRESYLKRYPAQ